MTDLTVFEQLAKEVTATVRHLRKTGREQVAAEHWMADTALDKLQAALFLLEDLSAEVD